MLYPSINEIKHKADSRYTLVILAAKRARDLVDGKPPLVQCSVNRPVSIAAREINEDMITVRYPEDKPEAPEEDIPEELAEGVAEEVEEAKTEAEEVLTDVEENIAEEVAADTEEAEAEESADTDAEETEPEPQE